LEHFEATVLVHLDAAYNLARWLIDDETAAEDAVQDACVRALRFFGTLSGPSPKAWFMAVVRNAASTCCASASTAGSTGGAALF
jgi:DNA-directed RNA polymerase specialized sigma24 family protein